MYVEYPETGRMLGDIDFQEICGGRAYTHNWFITICLRHNNIEWLDWMRFNFLGVSSKVDSWDDTSFSLELL